MEQQIGTHGVAGLKKYDIKVSGIVFMLYCLVGAGAFGIEEMIPEAYRERALEWRLQRI